MKDIRFTSLDRILSKLYRDLGLEEISETDVIEWSGEALEFLSNVTLYEEAIALLEVKNHSTTLPQGLHSIIQVVRDNVYRKPNKCNPETEKNKIKKHFLQDTGICNQCSVERFLNMDIDSYVLTNFEKNNVTVILSTLLQKPRYSPIRLSNHTFFNSLVCQEEDIDIYKSCQDEYTVVDDKLRFSFKEGFILLSYYRQKIDKETGYPLVPDDVSVITAITYYITWKYFQRLWYMGREGMSDKMQQAEERWLKYCGQVNSSMNMISGLDAFENFSQMKKNPITNRNAYFGYFGNISKLQYPKYYKRWN
jgi:hypothetical protein